MEEWSKQNSTNFDHKQSLQTVLHSSFAAGTAQYHLRVPRKSGPCFGRIMTIWCFYFLRTNYFLGAHVMREDNARTTVTFERSYLNMLLWPSSTEPGKCDFIWVNLFLQGWANWKSQSCWAMATRWMLWWLWWFAAYWLHLITKVARVGHGHSIRADPNANVDVDQSTVVTSPLQTIEVDKYVFKLATTVGKVRNPAEVRPLHLLMRKPKVFFFARYIGISIYLEHAYTQTHCEWRHCCCRQNTPSATRNSWFERQPWKHDSPNDLHYLLLFSPNVFVMKVTQVLGDTMR